MPSGNWSAKVKEVILIGGIKIEGIEGDWPILMARNCQNFGLPLQKEKANTQAMQVKIQWLYFFQGETSEKRWLDSWRA